MGFKSIALLALALHECPVDAHKRVLLESVKTITLKKGQVCRSSACALFPCLILAKHLHEQIGLVEMSSISTH